MYFIVYGTTQFVHFTNNLTMYFAVLDYYYRIYLDSTVINTVPVKKKKHVRQCKFCLQDSSVTCMVFISMTDSILAERSCL